MLTATLTLTPARCAPNEPVDAELRAVNEGGEAVTVGFGSGLRADFVLRDETGAARWRWSADRVFAQMLGEETLEPRGGVLVCRARVPAPAAPGRYRVVATLASYDHPLDASAALVVA